jgi:thiol-disulfide isomerase/thioredoxin
MQKDSKIYLVVGLILAVIVVGLAVYGAKSANSGPGELDDFATCLKDQGATFYGAFWCPHCQATKRLFGKSADKLPYVECSTPDGNGQTQICIDKKIQGYPTWIFKDGSQLTGEQTLEALSGKTGCLLPGATTTPIGTASTTLSNSTSSKIK